MNYFCFWINYFSEKNQPVCLLKSIIYFGPIVNMVHIIITTTYLAKRLLELFPLTNFNTIYFLSGFMYFKYWNAHGLYVPDEN